MNRNEAQQNDQRGGHGHGGHRWMMIGCGALLVIAVVLAATGRASVAYISVAVVCVAMMAMMMSMMGGRGRGGDKR